jgi:glycyl-tRNA synthetase beta chain
MVGEFPELQGVMGKYYALANGEDSLVASAIGEQYLPRTVQDKIPSSLTGSLLSALDKCDLIVACFGLGLEPSSSVDPYGLRRSATAVLKILVDKQLPVSLPKLLEEVKKELGPYVLKDKEAQLTSKLNAFFKDRFKALMADRGYAEDLIEAVITSRFESPYEASKRVAALAKLRNKEEFTRSGKVVERLTNILKGNKEALPTSVNPGLFAEELEKGVFERFQAFNDRLEDARKQADYGLATSLYAEAFFDILNEFFEKVFVYCDDLSVRRNRLLLLRMVKELYTKDIADLSKIRL